jgi:hypothetical protein
VVECSKTKVVLFLGAGFSVPSGYPCTAQLNKTLLDTPTDSRDIRIEEFISTTIGKFWEDVFAWRRGTTKPSLEDHFTQIDMAVKSGHGLGPDYDSAKLRAIHKMTIHRIFSWLRKPKGLPDYDAGGLIVRLSRTFEVTIITTNWDTHGEWILDAEGPGIPFNYGVGEVTPDGTPVEQEGDITLLKLHGCVNMSYCDCCQQWTRLGYGSPQAATDYELLLDARDFRLLGADAALADHLKGNQWHQRLGACWACGTPLEVPVLTFTYRKDVEKFRSVWDGAKTALQLADRWLFVGYSMPEADVEVRHLLKSTQLARKDPDAPLFDVVLKADCDAGLRHQRFFGLPCGKVFQDGIKEWVAKRLDDYCR